MAKTLTAIAVKNLRPRTARYETPDGGCRGLWVVTQPTGSRSYAVRYRFRGVARKLTLGSVLIEDGRRESSSDKPVLDTPLTLADARWLAAEALRQVKSGIDPAGLKRSRPATDSTVRTIADEYLQRHTHLRSLSRVAGEASLICQSLGSRLIGDVTRLDLVRLLDRIEDENGAATADRVHAVWRAIANWHAGRTDFRPPTVRGKRNKTGARLRVLADDEIRRIWLAAESMRPFGDFVQFLLLTAVRRDEARCMRRSELVDPATWVIPGARCKTKVDVLIPLSGAAQRLIAGMPSIGDGDFVFTVSGQRPLGDMSKRKSAIDAASGVMDWRLHDLRRSVRTLLSRAGVAPDVAEKCLGHAVGGVRAVYDRYEFEQEKRAAFQALANLVGEIVDRAERQ